MGKKQPAQSPPQKPRTVRAITACYVGDALRKPGEKFVHDGPLGVVLAECEPDEMSDGDELIDALTKGLPLRETRRTGTAPDASDDVDSTL